jgi:ABC-type branched-subunit amino acid transport system ATPase component
MNALACDNVSVRFRAAAVLNAVSFVALPGSLIAIVGANGAGKTTLLNVLSGHLQPSTGSVRLGNEIINGRPRHVLARLGIFRSFQNGQLFDTLSVNENLTVALRPAPDESFLGALVPRNRSDPASTRREKTVSSAACAVGITAYQARPAAELSYGMRRRAILAQAAIADSVVCLLDEPLAGVDPTSRDEALGFIARLRDPSRIVILVEHDLDAVRLIADRVLVLDQGRLMSDGPPDEICPSDTALAMFAQTHAQ